jgi:large subunit ribosomal protein L22
VIQFNTQGLQEERTVMAYDATHKFARISARKVRPIANMIRGKHADEALEILKYQPQRGARLLEKVLKSALGNAEDRRAPDVGNLVVVDARIDGGPMFKRIRPRARGMAFGILRRMSHIKVSLDTLS